MLVNTVISIKMKNIDTDVLLILIKHLLACFKDI